MRVLERGYAICTDAEGNVVSAADQVAIGAEVNVQLARGRLGAEVRRRILRSHSSEFTDFLWRFYSDRLSVLCG